MSKFMSAVFKESGLAARHDDDLTDRLVSRYSASIFITLCVIVSTSSYVGNPIHCWCPAEFTGTHAAYANAKCLISPTYSQDFDEALPQEAPHETYVNYYVWVPFILLCEACLCVLPSVLWKSLYKGAGFNVARVIEKLESSKESRDSAVKYIVENLMRYSEAYRETRFRVCRSDSTCCLGRYSGNYLTLCYLLVKFMYVLVVTGQFVLLNIFLSMDFGFFGRDMLRKYFSGSDNWSEMDRFPKVTICEFKVRHMQVTQPMVVQCVLPINLFNEKIFLFIWVWLVVLSCCTVYSLLKWSVKSVWWRARRAAHVKRQLRFNADNYPNDFKQKLSDFTDQIMRRDVMLLLRLVSHNVGPLTEAAVIRGLWDKVHGTEENTTDPLSQNNSP